jgi:hypothetical protein
MPPPSSIWPRAVWRCGLAGSGARSNDQRLLPGGAPSNVQSGRCCSSIPRRVSTGCRGRGIAGEPKGRSHGRARDRIRPLPNVLASLSWLPWHRDTQCCGAASGHLGVPGGQPRCRPHKHAVCSAAAQQPKGTAPQLPHSVWT